MDSGTRERPVDARALAVSILVHAIVITLVVGGPSHPRATWTAASASLVDVALVEPREAGGSTMPALPDALASPVVMEGAHEVIAQAPALLHRRVLMPRTGEHAAEAETIATPGIDLASAPEPSSQTEPSTAPSSIGDSTGTADELGSGIGEAGPSEGHPTQPTEPSDRCGDPINGVWYGRAWVPDFGRAGLWFEVRLTLRRDGERAEGSAQMRELWPRARESAHEWTAVTCAEFGGVFSVTTDAHGRRMTEPGAPDGAWDVLTEYYGPEDVVSMCGAPSFRGPRRRQIVMRVDGTDRAEGRAPWSFTLTRSSCAP